MWKSLDGKGRDCLHHTWAFVFLFISCGASASTGEVASQLGWLIVLLLVCAVPVILLNLALHKHIQGIRPGAASSGLKQTIISSLLFTPLEAALVLPAINLVIATRILRHGAAPPN